MIEVVRTDVSQVNQLSLKKLNPRYCSFVTLNDQYLDSNKYILVNAFCILLLNSVFPIVHNSSGR